MNQETLSEAVVVLVQCARSLSDDVRSISRSLNMIERRGIALKPDPSSEDVILTRLRTLVWPAEDRMRPVHKLSKSSKDGVLTHA